MTHTVILKGYTHVRRHAHEHRHHRRGGCESRSPVSAKVIKQTPPLCAAALIKLSCMCLSEKEIQERALVVPKFTCPVKTLHLSKLFLLSHMETKFIMPLLNIQVFVFL